MEISTKLLSNYIISISGCKVLVFNFVVKLKNERGAGRKEMFTEEQKARVKMLRLQDKSYRAIAKDMKCSVATVHKIINEQQC